MQTTCENAEGTHWGALVAVLEKVWPSMGKASGTAEAVSIEYPCKGQFVQKLRNLCEM